MRFKVPVVVLAVAAVCSSAFGLQTKSIPTKSPSQPTPDIADVIRRFAESETQNAIARNNYTFTQDFDVATVGEAGSVTGRFKRVSDIVLDDRGQRFEKITYFPPSTLATLQLTAEDMQDLAGVQPFALTTKDLPKYQVDYIGKEKIDELNTYVFDVRPKAFIKGERYLQGRIWVDDQDLQVVKVKGQAVPELEKPEQKFPHFESYRENIDGKFWFPTYIYADDVLGFKSGDIHIRMTVRFTNYKKFSGRIRLADEGEAVSDEEVKAAEKSKPSSKTKPPEPQKNPDPNRPPQ